MAVPSAMANPLPGCCASDGCGVHSPHRLRLAAPKRARSALAALKTTAPSSSDETAGTGPTIRIASVASSSDAAASSSPAPTDMIRAIA